MLRKIRARTIFKLKGPNYKEKNSTFSRSYEPWHSG